MILVVSVAVLMPATAFAVWGGSTDTAHPGVGAMYFDFMGGGEPIIDGLICSGSYAGESKDGAHDVFLLAGHCLPPPDSGIGPEALYVSFDNNSSKSSTADLVSDPIQVEEFHQMPGFGHDRGDSHDLAVLLLPLDSAGVPAVQLPVAGYLDMLKKSGALQFRLADVVGYGVTPVWGPGGPTTFDFDGVRRSGTSVINGLTKANLRYNQNPNGIGTGSGLCFGDSGSPQFDHGTNLVLSVTSGGNGQCNSANYNYRVDTPLARAFLGQYLDLP